MCVLLQIQGNLLLSSSLYVLMTYSCIAPSNIPSTDTPGTPSDPLQQSFVSAPADLITAVCSVSASFVPSMSAAQMRKTRATKQLKVKLKSLLCLL